jgi:hypothetical protein
MLARELRRAPSQHLDRDKGFDNARPGRALFLIDFVEPPRNREFMMNSIPLWGFGAVSAGLGTITILVGFVKRKR